MPNGRNNPGANAVSVPCKISPDRTGRCTFQIEAKEMPVKIKLCEDQHGNPATTSSFNRIDVTVMETNPPTPVPGQPTSMTATTASLNLQEGAYDIVTVVNPLPNSKAAFVYEDCSGLNQLCAIPTPVKISCHFSLRVI